MLSYCFYHLRKEVGCGEEEKRKEVKEEEEVSPAVARMTKTVA